MGIYKQMCIDLNCDCPDEQEILKVEKQVFRREIEEVIKGAATNNEILDEFLSDVIVDETGRKYYLLVGNKEGINCQFAFDSSSEYISAIKKLCKKEYNVLYTLTSYDVEFRERNAGKYRSICIDIDDFDIDITQFTKNEIIEFLKSKYDVDDEHLPNWCAKSGHGLHLYYLVDKSSDRETRREYVDRMITFWGADKSCNMLYHMFRVPTSYNCKREPIKTELYKINDSVDRDIHRLSYFEVAKEEIDAYYRILNLRRAEKARTTREKNGTSKKKDLKDKAVSTAKKLKNLAFATDNCTEDTEVYKVDSIEGFKYYTHFKPKEFDINMLKDLNNYFIRHNGELYRKRNTFAYILANYSVQIMDETKCVALSKKYFHPSFWGELQETVSKTYNRGFKKIPYIKIANLLEFTDKDIAESYGCFSAERKAQAKKNKSIRQNDKRKAEVRKKKEEWYNTVKNNMNTPSNKLAQKCGVSKSTIDRIKRRIREEKLCQK